MSSIKIKMIDIDKLFSYLWMFEVEFCLVGKQQRAQGHPWWQGAAYF
jgi:hypothetical protein